MDQERVDVGVRDRRMNAGDLLAEYSRGFHWRGFWSKIWIAFAPSSTPRSIAFAGPPLGLGGR